MNALIDLYDKLSLLFQANRIACVICELFSTEGASEHNEQEVVVVTGFLFGCRVAMVLATFNPDIIRCMHNMVISVRRIRVQK